MKRSIGELFVSKVLRNIGVCYFQDMSIDGLRGVKNGILKFDFVIPSTDGRKVIIEYNGIFHYHVIQGKTTLSTLAKQQMNDVIKNDYCIRNKIPILWIPYWLNNKEVKKEVEMFLHKYM